MHVDSDERFGSGQIITDPNLEGPTTYGSGFRTLLYGMSSRYIIINLMGVICRIGKRTNPVPYDVAGMCSRAGWDCGTGASRGTTFSSTAGLDTTV